MARLARRVGRYLDLAVAGTSYPVYFEEAGEGVPLFCQHTAGSDGRQWRHLLEDPWLGERFRVIAWDLPYHGKSLPPWPAPGSSPTGSRSRSSSSSSSASPPSSRSSARCSWAA
jgi:pimeloyl-ACP methyl ester carboxylesterase